MVDRDTYDSSKLAARLLAALQAVHGDSLEIRDRSMDLLGGTSQVRAIADGSLAVDTALEHWPESIREFRVLRAPYLLYPQQF